MIEASPKPQSTGRRQLVLGLLPLLAGVGAAHAQEEPSALERIRAHGALKVALYNAFPPFSAPSAQGMQGLDVSLAQALARAMGLQLSLLPFDGDENMSDDLRNMVWKGHYLGYGPADVMLHVPVDKYFMQQNQQALIFAPYMREQVVLVRDKRRLPAVAGAADLKGVPLAAERGTGAASALIGHDNRLLSAQVHLYENGVKAVQAVLQGEVAAAYVTRAQAESAIFHAQPRPEQMEISEFPLTGVPSQGWLVGMAIKARNEALGQALQQALESLRGSGELLAIFKQHGLTFTAP
ncbi:substrate-binding periplasmic protein [Alicycliphilus denitrificans]|uniref:substrate-binding periplasmic protein n=1 Tax=Alicycliphilus denitrificans TaxID=179636 RepID=UPI003850AE70